MVCAVWKSYRITRPSEMLSLFLNVLANKNKEKELKLIVCTKELKDIKEMANDVIQAVKRAKRSNTEDLASTKSVLKELHLALGTFFEQI